MQQNHINVTQNQTQDLIEIITSQRNVALNELALSKSQTLAVMRELKALQEDSHQADAVEAEPSA